MDIPLIDLGRDCVGWISAIFCMTVNPVWFVRAQNVESDYAIAQLKHYMHFARIE